MLKDNNVRKTMKKRIKNILVAALLLVNIVEPLVFVKNQLSALTYSSSTDI